MIYCSLGKIPGRICERLLNPNEAGRETTDRITIFLDNDQFKGSARSSLGWGTRMMLPAERLRSIWTSLLHEPLESSIFRSCALDSVTAMQLQIRVKAKMKPFYSVKMTELDIFL